MSQKGCASASSISSESRRSLEYLSIQANIYNQNDAYILRICNLGTVGKEIHKYRA